MTLERFNITDVKGGLDLYYKVCPEFICQDSIFSIKANKFPHTENVNVNIIEKDANKVFIDKLIKNEPFSVSRYNDGEWIAMLKLDYTGNSPYPSWDKPYSYKDWVWGKDGQDYVDNNLMPVMLSRPKYFVGISSQVFKKKYMSEKVAPYIIGLSLVDGGLFTRIAITGEILAYFNQFKKRNVIVVGPPYCKDMKTHFDFTHVITNDNVWNESKRIEAEIEHHLTGLDNPVIVYACSFVAKKLIDVFYHKYTNVTQLDFGSAVCPYSGIKLRTYHKYVDIK